MDKVLSETAGVREKRWWTRDEFNNHCQRLGTLKTL